MSTSIEISNVIPIKLNSTPSREKVTNRGKAVNICVHIRHSERYNTQETFNHQRYDKTKTSLGKQQSNTRHENKNFLCLNKKRFHVQCRTMDTKQKIRKEN